mmetsp:Transcript_20784/g.43548  ORF Transcript_20784/g.43548 Transcript_20784/m.43548 type:complete len:139 (-) Transcript_20784:703-1119(-)
MVSFCLSEGTDPFWFRSEKDPVVYTTPLETRRRLWQEKAHQCTAHRRSSFEITTIARVVGWAKGVLSRALEWNGTQTNELRLAGERVCERECCLQSRLRHFVPFRSVPFRFELVMIQLSNRQVGRQTQNTLIITAAAS